MPRRWLVVAAAAAALALPTPARAKSWRDLAPFAPPTLRDDGKRKKPPWRRRSRRSVSRMRAHGQGRIDLRAWPAEPRSPATIDRKRFGRSFRTLCGGWMPPRRPFSYGGWMIEHGKTFGVDPFVLGALAYRQTRCLPRLKTAYGLGLMMINPGMHVPDLRKRRYAYWAPVDGRGWQRREAVFDRFSFTRRNLLRAESSIYFAAGLLGSFARQCPAIDRPFASVPHRHAVSHFIWGDRVRGAGAEDRVLLARRRLLRYYRDRTPAPRGRFRTVALHCPLDGAPRKISSAFGEDRDKGARRHRGLDFSSSYGEPVRAIAAGRVTLAGVDRPTGKPRNLDPEAAAALRSADMGKGGLLVMMRHAEGLISAYMHLSSYTVRARDRVKAGTIIGYVGRTGVRTSGPHLHFELRHAGRHIDPLPHLKPYLIAPIETYAGRRRAADRMRARRRRRIARWRAYKAARRAAAAAATTKSAAGGGSGSASAATTSP